MIHKSAIIDKSAKLDSNVNVGPFSIIGPEVEIESGTSIGSHVVIAVSYTHLRAHETR
mgnify:CR=1 FL=1